MLRAMTDHPRSPLRLLHQMARSGGTVISRCLACMSGVALLSEVHARATGFVDPLAQAQAWFAPFGRAEWEALCARGPAAPLGHGGGAGRPVRAVPSCDGPPPARPVPQRVRGPVAARPPRHRSLFSRLPSIRRAGREAGLRAVRGF